MKLMKKAIALGVAVSLTFLNIPVSFPPAHADDTDIFGANIQPNVMILIDSSQSMSDPVPTAIYDPGVTYTVLNLCGSTKTSPCDTPVVYRKGSGSTFTLYKSTVAQVPSASAQTALNTVGYWTGTISGTSYQLFVGNYLNSQLGVCATPPCQEPKITIAKRVVENVIANTEGVRFGTMKFKSGGGQVISPIGTPVGDINTAGTLLYGVHNMTQTSVGTMTGEQLRDAGRYYKGQLGLPSPIQYECQPSFVILISDGLYTGIDPRPEGTNRFIQDHDSGFTGTQNVIVHTVGFGVGASEPAADLAANDVLRQTAQNGGGSFYKTDTSAQLEAALQNFILQIVAATFSFATPVVPTTSATGSSRAYLAAFQSNPSRPFWRGYLKAYDRDANGVVRLLPDGTPDPQWQAWEAGSVLAAKAASSRVIKTVIGGSLQDFTTSNVLLTAALLGVSVIERDNLINYLRGIDAYDEDVDGNSTEERDWKLGDIFHSTPVLVTPPIAPSSDASYIAFRTANASRTTALIAGSNGGKLHAFRESDGEELWAFIPPDLLGALKTLTIQSADHPFYVDGSPVAADVKIGGNWKTIVVVGERRGGKSYHALDITDTTSPQYLWSFTDAKLGETWSEPVIGKMQVSGVEKYVAIVGGGYDTAQNNSLGKAVFAIDVATGQKLWEYSNPGSPGDDRQYLNFSVAANPTAADLDRNGFIDRVYIGDVGGQLWKFGPADPALPADLATNWTGKRLFAAAPSQANPPVPGEYYPTQAIYGAPIPAYDPQGNLWIYFGTGDRNHPNNTTAPNRFYGIKDNVGMTNGSHLTETSLVDITSTNLTATQGWYFLLGTKEKVLATADVFNQIVFFSAFTPTGVAACGTGGGTAKLYAVQMTTGYAAIDWALGVALTSTSSAETRDKTIGTGIPSRPIIVITESGATISTSVIAATTSQQLPSNPAPPPSAMRKVLYWREMF